MRSPSNIEVKKDCHYAYAPSPHFILFEKCIISACNASSLGALFPKRYVYCCSLSGSTPWHVLWVFTRGLSVWIVQRTCDFLPRAKSARRRVTPQKSRQPLVYRVTIGVLKFAFAFAFPPATFVARSTLWPMLFLCPLLSTSTS